MMKSVEPTWSASSDDLVGALGMHDDDAVRMLGPESLDVRGSEPLVDRAVPLPEQERGLLDVDVVEPAQLVARVPRRACRTRRSRAGSRCCGRGAGPGRTAPCPRRRRGAAPGSSSPSAQVSTARAFDEVQTAPPWRPTNAFSAADEFM